LAFLRAFIDDSATDVGDRRLFMAGYLHRADQWAEFSDVWDRELRSWPSIEYFKMSEAQNLKEQFDHKKGWTEEMRDAKVGMLAEIIQHFEAMSFELSIPRAIYYDELTPFSPRGLNPHFTSCFHVVAGLASYIANEGAKTTIDFIFDQQDGVDDDIMLFFSHMKKNLPQDVQYLIEGYPNFENDKDKRYLPLQAADLLAWHLRREHEDAIKLPLTEKLCNGHLVAEITDDIIKKWREHHKSLPRIGQIQGKGQWHSLKREIRRLIAAGIDPATIKPKED
jgi:hypothetical protein